MENKLPLLNDYFACVTTYYCSHTSNEKFQEKIPNKKRPEPTYKMN